MHSAMFILFLVLILGLNGFVTCERPAVVNVGAILAYDSVIGRVVKPAIEAAVADVNADKDVLAGTRINLIMQNALYSNFIGTMGALKVLEKDAIVIIGPQAATTAHVISTISDELQIPLVSYSVTDPSLSSLQYPFFIRMTQSDSYQMAAVADFIDYCGWKRVIGIYVDNEYGRNGIYSLDDELAAKTSTIYKFGFPLKASRDYLINVLKSSNVIGPRVYVVHANPDSGLDVLSVAQELNMMTNEYVWLVTDWFCNALESSDSVLNHSLHHLQGIVGVCQFVPESIQQRAFASKWQELYKKNIVHSKLNVFGFYAYDTIWAVAHAINDFLEDSGNITFTSNDVLVNLKGKIQFNKLKTFDGGHLLLQKLLGLNFTGLTGRIQFDSDHNLKSGRYKIINIHDDAIHTVGFWVNNLGLTSSPPNSLYEGRRNFSVEQILHSVTWPSGKKEKPRGWVVATNEKPLRILVPRRVSFTEFVTAMDGNHSVKGYCIDVFEAAIKLVPYEIPHVFVPFGDGVATPSYGKLVNMIADEAFDGAVGDISIVKNRTQIVDFTQPYASSGLVIVVPVRRYKSNAWVFLRPFSWDMWLITGAFFFLIGIVTWLLEHRVNNDFRGPPKRQCQTIFLFSFATLFHSQQENTVSTLGRFVMVVWFFLLLVVTSSYTASLTSFLTVQQLASPINGIDSLIANNQPIGYQEGSFARVYLIDNLKVRPSRLVCLRTPEDYAKALERGPRNGGVAAIVDELPYVDLFLRERSGFRLVGQPFTRRGWGFAFPRGSPLPVDLSTAILKLSESGELQKIHSRWFCDNCSTTATKAPQPNQLQLSSFLGLFLICGIVSIASLLIFLFKAIRQFIRFKRKHRDAAEISPQHCSHMVYSFFDFLDEREEKIKNMFKQQNEVS